MKSLTSDPQIMIAGANVAEAQSDLLAARGAFLPSGQLSLEEQRYAPSTTVSPVVVIGNTVIGGAQTKSAFGSLSLSWNLLNSGRDLAAYRGAKADVRAASSGLKSQLEDTLTGVLQAYADLYEAEVAARDEASTVESLKSIQMRAQDRYAKGHGTVVAIGQARAASLDATQSLNQACRSVADKSAALASAIGISIPARERFDAGAALPLPNVDPTNYGDLDGAVKADPAVVAAQDKVTAAQSKVQQALRSLGPTVSFFARRDYLGQSVESYGQADARFAPYDYQIGLSFQQELFPFTSEGAQIGKARAELRRAQAEYQQARLDAQTKLRGALNAQREAQASYLAAKTSLSESEHVLELTESLYRAGHTDLDNVEHARIDRNRAEADTRTLESKRAAAEWAAARALEPAQFPNLLFRQLHLESQVGQWPGGN